MQPVSTQPAEDLQQTAATIKVRGHLRILNFFDIAEAIDLEKLRELLGPEASRRSPGFVHLTPEYAQAQNQPLHESVEPVVVPTGETLQATIKYYWFGVAVVELATRFDCDFD